MSVEFLRWSKSFPRCLRHECASQTFLFLFYFFIYSFALFPLESCWRSDDPTSPTTTLQRQQLRRELAIVVVTQSNKKIWWCIYTIVEAATATSYFFFHFFFNARRIKTSGRGFLPISCARKQKTFNITTCPAPTHYITISSHNVSLPFFNLGFIANYVNAMHRCNAPSSNIVSRYDALFGAASRDNLIKLNSFMRLRCCAQSLWDHT